MNWMLPAPFTAAMRWEACAMRWKGCGKKLAKRQGQIWEEMEEQRRLNAAFAHDLRTPLTVLQGYVDLLETYYPAGRISQEKMMEILEMMGGQVDRLRRFGDTMKKIHSLEERGAVRRRMRVEELARRLEESAGMLVSGPGEGIDTRPCTRLDGESRCPAGTCPDGGFR